MRTPEIKFDYDRVKSSQRHRVNKPSWRGVYIYLLEVRDLDSAHLVRSLNDEKYRAETLFPVQGAQLRSLREVQADRDAAEAA